MKNFGSEAEPHKMEHFCNQSEVHNEGRQLSAEQGSQADDAVPHVVL